MKPFSFCLLAAAALLPSVAKCSTPFEGRWDLIVTPKAAGVKIYPDWMEVGVKDGAPAVRIQPRSGSAFYAKEFKTEGTHLSVLWANGTTTWDLDVKDGKLTGTREARRTTCSPISPACARPRSSGSRRRSGPPPSRSSTARISPAGNPPTRPRPITGCGEGWRTGQRNQGREPENHAQVRRFQTAHRIQLPRGRQQRHLSARPLRSAGGIREGRCQRQVPQHRRGVQHARAGRGVAAQAGHLGDASTSRWWAAG